MFLRDVYKRSEAKSEEDKATRLMLAQMEKVGVQTSRFKNFQTNSQSSFCQAAKKQFAQDTGTLYVPTGDDIPAPSSSSHYTARESSSSVIEPDPQPEYTDYTPHVATDEEPFGAWTVVEEPPPPPPKMVVKSEDGTTIKEEEGKPTTYADDDDEEPEENPREFKIKEKSLQVDTSGLEELESGSGSTFKKRKLGGSKGVRNIRKRID